MKTPVWSHTFLNTYGNCPKQCFHKFVAKDLPFVETEAMTWGNRVHKAMEQRIKMKLPLPEGMETYEAFIPPENIECREAELQVGMTINGRGTGFFTDNVWGRGKIDVVLIQNGVCVFLDWKTGKVREDPAELDTFAVLLQANNREIKKWVGHYVWLKENRLGVAHELQPERKLQEIRHTMAQVEQAVREQQWPATPNALCKAHCDVFSCAHNGRKR